MATNMEVFKRVFGMHPIDLRNMKPSELVNWLRSTYQDKAGVRVEDIGLSLRAQNALKRSGYKTLADFVGVSEANLMCLDGIGYTLAKEIAKKLREYGMEVD